MLNSSAPNSLTTPVFTERLEFLLQSQFWSAERLRDLQIRKLQHTIYHAARDVPYYQKHFAKERLTWEDFKGIGDVQRLPLIDKHTIQQDYDLFISRRYTKGELFHRSTGGSTGHPLTVFSDLDFFGRDKANTNYYMRVFGLDIFSHRSIRLYGDKLDQSLLESGTYWRLEEGRRLVMSCYHVSRDTARLYVEKINKFRPRYLHTRPSAVLPLARYVLDQRLPLEPVRFLFCDGEHISDGQRRIIEQAFQGRLLNVYGHTEGSAVGHPCPLSDHLHFMPQVGILELLDKAGNSTSLPGERGEMVVTGFNNPVFPLLRYRTGDVAIRGAEFCPCGRNYPLVERLEGRIQDYVVDKFGGLIPLAPAIFNYNDMDWRGVREFKVIQDEAGKILLNIQPEVELEADLAGAERRIASCMNAIFGERIKVTIRFVPEIARTAIGKLRYLEQNLDTTKYGAVP